MDKLGVLTALEWSCFCLIIERGKVNIVTVKETFFKHPGYEIVQNDTIKNSCPACISLLRNNKTLAVLRQQWQTLVPNVTFDYTVQSPQHLAVTFCKKNNLCDHFVVQV